jgi:septum formation protein
MYPQEESHKTRIILASASPRRRKIFEDLGLDFEVMEPGGGLEEISGDPVHTAVANSIIKAKYVSASLAAREKIRYLVSGFDTIVYLGKKILGKPGNAEEAYSFIQALSGRSHRVVTGICIIDSINGRQVTGQEISQVEFRDLELPEIRQYLKREYVLDKAGAYNIAGPGALLVKKVRGCMFNIIGVPVFRYAGLLEKFDYKILYHSKE